MHKEPSGGKKNSNQVSDCFLLSARTSKCSLRTFISSDESLKISGLYNKKTFTLTSVKSIIGICNINLSIIYLNSPRSRVLTCSLTQKRWMTCGMRSKSTHSSPTSASTKSRI